MDGYLKEAVNFTKKHPIITAVAGGIAITAAYLLAKNGNENPYQTRNHKCALRGFRNEQQLHDAGARGRLLQYSRHA